MKDWYSFYFKYLVESTSDGNFKITHFVFSPHVILLTFSLTSCTILIVYAFLLFMFPCVSVYCLQEPSGATRGPQIPNTGAAGRSHPVDAGNQAWGLNGRQNSLSRTKSPAFQAYVIFVCVGFFCCCFIFCF